MKARFYCSCFIALLCLGSLSAAYVLELGFGFRPCQLCLYERIPYILILLLSISAMHKSSGLWAMKAISVVSALGMALVTYHLMIEKGVTQVENSCSIGQSQCSVEQKLLGLPLTILNLLLTILILVISIVAIYLEYHGRHRNDKRENN